VLYKISCGELAYHDLFVVFLVSRVGTEGVEIFWSDFDVGEQF
jgi:hypothetical protein